MTLKDTPKSAISALDPAQFPEVPEVEGIDAPVKKWGRILLSLPHGEEVTARPADLTVYASPEGLPVFVEVGGREADPEDPEDAGEYGDIYRLPADFAHLFAWGVQSPYNARAAAEVKAAYAHLSLALNNPGSPNAAWYLQHAALNALSAATVWPEDGEEEGRILHAGSLKL